MRTLYAARWGCSGAQGWLTTSHLLALGMQEVHSEALQLLQSHNGH